MTFVTRLKVATALLGVAAAVTCTQVLGDSSRDDGPLGAKSPAADRWADGLAASKFANTPVLTYETGKGEHLFALQLRPGLPEAAPADTARPRDLLILIDTSASQAGKPYLLAQEIAAALIRDASPADRVSLWTLNTPGATRDLANGFQEPRSPALQNALKRLKEVEYPSGASDLKDGLRRVLKTFEPRFSRQQVLLFIGDAQSAYNPLAEPERLALAAELRASLVGFFAVPLGPDIHAENLHTLVAGTGGAVVRVPVRLKGAERMNELVARFNEAVRVPVLMPDEFRLPEGVAEFFPTKLPPLRADAPTLVVGKFKGGPVKLEGTVKGTVAGRPVTVAFAHDAPAPQADNYFLASVLDQWRAAPRPDAPALLRADRTLALAYEQCRLARTELLSQAHWAVHEGEYGAAKNLYLAAAALDPADQEARFGLKVAEKLRQGELTKKDLEDKAEAKGEGLLIRPTREQQVNAVRVRLEELAGQEQPPPPPAPAVPGADELLRQEQARRAVVEQRTRIVVEETLRRARQLLATDPEGAADLLKRQLDAVLQDPDLSENVRRSLAANLEAMLREVTVRGAMIRQRAEEERRRIARARAAIAAQERLAALAERQRERIRAFAALMNQARYEEAYREALIMQQEAVNLGLPVPIETTASYIIGENATNLRELQELRRIREERFLLTMMQVEKSHVPYPDEPPVHFPPAAVWRELFQQRKGYELSGLGQPESPQTQLMRNKLDEPFTNERAFDGVPLEAALEVIGLKTGITFLIDTAAFKAEDATREITQQGVRLPVLRNVSLATALRMMLDDIGATYQVRRDYIDIVPISKAYADKVVRVFPVADLVIPIPQSVNPAVLQQNLQLLGSSATILGQGLLGVLGSAPPGFLAGGGFQFGGGFGAFGAGAFGALGAAGGIQGLAGGGLQGGNAGFGGGPFQGGGNVNLGFGGGVLGFGGGQLGQFGNLGGQFGLQGGNQADILIALIQQVVEPGYWGTTTPGVIQQGQNDPLLQEGVEPVAPLEQLNTIGFYPPANALVVRGFSRRFAPLERPMRRSDPLGGGLPPLMGRAVPLKPKPGGGDGLAARPGGGEGGKPGGGEAVARAGAGAKKPLDPRKIWAEFLAGGVDDPGLIIAGADFLAQAGEMDHAAEMLKASLRRGLIAEPWAHEALAVALEATQGAPEEIERAHVSAVDLRPQDADGYLRAAEALADLKRPEVALRFCEQAAKLEPNRPDPYADALVYAGEAERIDADAAAWAAGNLLGQDWPLDGDAYHQRAKDRLAQLREALRKQGRAADAEKLAAAVARERQRDLVVRLAWEGSADLDLTVLEPAGTRCSVLDRQTQNGGVLKADDLMQTDRQRSEVYTAAEAFEGTYTVEAKRVWGRPLGNKATVQVIKHQGTPQETSEVHTLRFGPDGKASLDFHLDGGRRTELAEVPPMKALLAREAQRDGTDPQEVMNRLRALSDPVTSRSPVAMYGGAGSAGRYAPQAEVPDVESAPIVGVTRQASFPRAVEGAANLAAHSRAVMTPRGPAVEVQVAPVFRTVTRPDEKPKVPLPTIPGNG